MPEKRSTEIWTHQHAKATEANKSWNIAKQLSGFILKLTNFSGGSRNSYGHGFKLQLQLLEIWYGKAGQWN